MTDPNKHAEKTDPKTTQAVPKQDTGNKKEDEHKHAAPSTDKKPDADVKKAI